MSELIIYVLFISDQTFTILLTAYRSNIIIFCVFICLSCLCEDKINIIICANGVYLFVSFQLSNTT